MGKFVTITEANGASNIGISQIPQADILNLDHGVKIEIMIHSLKLEYNILMEKMIRGANVPIDTFSLTETIIENAHMHSFMGAGAKDVETNSKALAKILYSELVRVAMQVAKRSATDIQIPDTFIGELENMSLKALKIIL